MQTAGLGSNDKSNLFIQKQFEFKAEGKSPNPKLQIQRFILP